MKWNLCLPKNGERGVNPMPKNEKMMV